MGSSYALNAITAPDSYTAASTIEGVPIDHILIDVANTSIFWQLKRATSSNDHSGNWDGTEVYMLPGSRGLFRQGITGIRIRAAVPTNKLPVGGVQAVVTVEAVT